MDENELEEGEYVEDDEEKERRKNKSTRWSNDNAKRFNKKPSYEKYKQRRNPAIFRTAVAAISKNSAADSRNQKRRSSAEDEEELLRQHLLKSMTSQENRSNTKQAKKGDLQQNKQSKSQRLEGNGRASTSSSAVSDTQKATTISEATDNIGIMTQALVVAQQQYDELKERRQTIQQSLITCEADLELVGEEVSNLIARISAAWNRQFNPLNQQNIQQKVEKPEVKLNDDNAKIDEKNQTQAGESKTNYQILVEQPQKCGVTEEMEEKEKPVSERSTTIPQIAVEQQESGVTKEMGEEENPTTKTSTTIPQIAVEQQESGVTEDNDTSNVPLIQPEPTNVDDVEQQSKIVQEEVEELEDGQILDDIIDEEMTQTNIHTEENLNQTDGLTENNANQMEEDENRMQEMGEIVDSQGQQFDPFLISIRSYRLRSPLFPQLISHPAISNRLNPYIPVCPYQLDGRCANRQCPYQHEEDYSLSEQQIIEEIIGYWPKICPNGMQPSQYAANLLANGPFDQVVGFLISRMPDSICIGGQKQQPFQRKATEKTIPTGPSEDDRIEYESILNKAFNISGNTITIHNQQM